MVRCEASYHGPSSLFADFCVELHGQKDATSNSAVRVLLARLRGARALKIKCLGNQPRALGAMFAMLLRTLDSLPVLDSLDIRLLTNLTSEQQLCVRRIAQLSSLRSLRLEGLKYRELQLLQGYSALSCLTFLHLELHRNAGPVPHTILLPSFVLQLQRLQNLAVWDRNREARYLLPKVDPVARLLVLLIYRDTAGCQQS